MLIIREAGEFSHKVYNENIKGSNHENPELFLYASIAGIVILNQPSVIMTMSQKKYLSNQLKTTVKSLLTHFWPMLLFYTHSGSLEWESWSEMR